MELQHLVERIVDEERDRLKEKLSKELERVANDTTAELEAKGQLIKEQLESLSSLDIPKDLLGFYLKTGGNVWVSKGVNVNSKDGIDVRNRGLSLSYNQFFVQLGTYRLVLLAIPMKPMRAGERDDYGTTAAFNGSVQIML